MTAAVIGLVPEYGLFLLFGVISLACLAIPLPSSVLVLTSGAFAASDDLTLWQVFVVAFVAFLIGDQIAFMIASRFGPRILDWMRGKPRLLPVLEKSEALLHSKGHVAVLLSHTILSPTCPYISYLCGAGGMRWLKFTIMAAIGAAIWTAAYVSLGYMFASQLSQVADILSNFFGIIFAGLLVLYCVIWLRRKWRAHLAEIAAEHGQ
ncbi:DedA family protein [Loktanella sp. F6476L]|uniref:DedA family protein n=1 Tax=Loktanella sp. F6476L TaxID=2926405 RepID=UPI001FF5CCC9|nr:DedA family protein [Loktanella sp. F6476L]MCK0121406.1 DedA family protein [Loktanella sp. F6476L]